MTVSAELSLYALTDSYEQPVIDFIHALRAQPKIEVVTNGLSTQVVGEYAAVMEALKQSMEPTLAREETCSFVIKILNVRIQPGEQVEV
ncbi:MAG: hypothetical protein AAF597_01690 [Bacteroidota bacterium]